KEGGLWKMMGNQRLIYLRVKPAAHKWIKADGSTVVKTGMEMQGEDQGVRGINSMRIQGPGLPTAGVTLSKTQWSVDRLVLDTQDFSLPTNNWEFGPLDDATISNLSEAAEAYTVTLYTDQTAPTPGSAFAQQFKGAIFKKPMLNSALANATYFGTATMPGINHTMNFANASILGKTVTVSVTKPTVYVIKWSSVGIEFWGNNPGLWVDKDVRQSAVSVDLIVPSAVGFTPNNGQIRFQTEDQFGREFTYHYMFQ
ncbi:MAG: hypothetical protein Q8K46_07720, partial [Deltaproteobacteria bacterium]|nr:hypothetical protein [Deltaproteobacteria bacterium]